MCSQRAETPLTPARRQAPERDADGNLAADPAAFPSGVLSLSRRVHALGLQFGMYSSAGFKTCQGLPASLGHEALDAARFASWEVRAFVLFAFITVACSR